MSTNELPEVFRRVDTVSDEADILSQKAAAVLADLACQYLVWTKDELDKMKDMLTQATHLTSAQRVQLICCDFFRKAHDIKGQGSTFDYPLMTEIGSFVCERLRHKTVVTDEDILLMNEMVDIMLRIVTQKITGDGGKIGAEIRYRIGKDEA